MYTFFLILPHGPMSIISGITSKQTIEIEKYISLKNAPDSEIDLSDLYPGIYPIGKIPMRNIIGYYCYPTANQQ